MLASTQWINDYLDRPASPEEQADLLTRAGFPLEGSETIKISSGTDVRQDFEMTSNRGDCTCHLGLAREVAAISGRTLVPPSSEMPEATGAPAKDSIRVLNHDSVGCPRYTARIIRGVKVGPSPQWLQDRLIARGDIPRNNVVDATNFVLFELGQPTHVFDLDLLQGGEINIRAAGDGEKFLPLGEGEAEITLIPDDLVIADANRAIALAGVKGGGVTAVTESTCNLLLEAATFAPVRVRSASRRHGISSDSAFRFERGVHPDQIARAADRLAALIIELAGGELAEGVVHDGAPIPEPPVVSMRPERCRQLLGVEIDDDRMLDMLARLEFSPRLDGDRIICTAPTHRLDIGREIDLIEEVGRMYGHDNIPVQETIALRIAPPQPTELARTAVANLLVGLGYIETTTHSLISDAAAAAFLPEGLFPLRVSDERAGAEPVLRPSVLPSLLKVAIHNRDHGNSGGPGVRLFESAATFARLSDDEHIERINLGVVHPAKDPSHGENPLRETRGLIERLVTLLRGPDATITVEPHDASPWLDPGAVVRFDGAVLGTYGLLAPAIAKQFDIKESLAVAELGLPALYDIFPPETESQPLPAFPAIERDLSALLDESVAWGAVHSALFALSLDALESIDFITTFRSKAIGSGRKSLTLRLRFRAADRTLTHEEVDPQVSRAIETLTTSFSAEIRT